MRASCLAVRVQTYMLSTTKVRNYEVVSLRVPKEGLFGLAISKSSLTRTRIKEKIFGMKILIYYTIN